MGTSVSAQTGSSGSSTSLSANTLTTSVSGQAGS